MEAGQQDNHITYKITLVPHPANQQPFSWPKTKEETDEAKRFEGLPECLRPSMGRLRSGSGDRKGKTKLWC